MSFIRQVGAGVTIDFFGTIKGIMINTAARSNSNGARKITMFNLPAIGEC